MSTIEYIAFDATRYPTVEDCHGWLKGNREYSKLAQLKGFKLKKVKNARLLTPEIRPAWMWQGDLAQSLNLSVEPEPLPYIAVIRVDGNRLKQPAQLLQPLPSTLEAEAKKKEQQEEAKRKAAEKRKEKKEQMKKDKEAGITPAKKKRKSSEREDPNQASPPHSATNGKKESTASAASSDSKIDSGKDEELEVDTIGLGNLDDIEEPGLSQAPLKREESKVQGPKKPIFRRGGLPLVKK